MRAAIDREIEKIQEQQEEKRREDEAGDNAGWMFVETRSSTPIASTTTTDQPTAKRSIFDDIDG